MKTLKDVNWNQVYYFYEVAKRLSMKDAAHHLKVSVPTVSEQIRKLEELLDVQLFRRMVRRLELTEDGVTLYNCAHDMFKAGVRFLDNVSPDPIGGYTVRVGVQETNCAAVSIDFIARYWEVFAPFGSVNTQRELYSERMMDKLVKGDLDWGISLDIPRISRLGYVEIGSYEIVFCCSHNIYNQFACKEDIVRSLPLARNVWDKTLNESVDRRLHDHNITPDDIIESDHREFCSQLAQKGRCIATFAAETLSTAAWGQSVSSFRIGPPLVLKLYAVWNRANERMIAIRKLFELLNPRTPAELARKPADFLPTNIQSIANAPSKR